ncbi:hypothetical protein [Burkholderia vietnamiensis]|jgi:hypothetical protein|uniref:hypothetical protein n=1 Tax=Burkholderia vietnamiensis TaxID=60552 RepID=UPI0012DA5CC5|nr:hypothetical protein [Burkholderia vietnamiensis]MBR7973569.1 hypothetical protein [Burkholderia vietnamiensis]HDR9157938.1 hypothetical protein [Burkholderia vietnamiensis]
MPFASRAAAICIGKRLHTSISAHTTAKYVLLLHGAPTVATIAAHNLSTVSKTGTVVDVLDIYGFFCSVTFWRHFIFWAFLPVLH